jgi:hypothetical protein
MFAASKTANVSSAINYIEDVFSTYLYTGDDSSSRLIQNNIDLSTKGGLVWLKCRSDAQNHALYDTSRGATKRLISNLTNAQDTVSGVSAFNTNGFTMGADLNYLGQTMASWTFRKQPKFFDIVTYTGTGSNTTIAHSLGSVPACIMVKRTNTTGAWQVYHSSLANTEYLVLNTTAAKATGATRWNSTTPTSSVFSLGTDATVNASGGTYVAYIFAHDAGGFGLTGTDNVISCGSYTGNGSATGPSVTLGYEPQWVMIKNTTNATPWIMLNNMMGLALTATNTLIANADYSETAQSTYFTLTATGFQLNTTDSDVNNSGSNYIYIAIRRGPMKVPTVGTSVFSTGYGYSSGTPRTVTTNFPVDLSLNRVTTSGGANNANDRLRGGTTTSYARLKTSTTDAEDTGTGSGLGFDNNTAIIDNGWWSTNTNAVYWNFGRAPSFFDEVCYTGTGSATTFSHNLGVVPELIIVKRRDTTGPWDSYSSALANTEYVVLNTTAAKATGATRWNSTTPTSSVFSVGTSTTTNASAGTYVAYLFATCAGVSKVGSYTGNGSTQTINCGFTGGARFVLIKRTDSTGDWYVYDTARGMTVLTDPYLLLNSTAAETATLGSVTTVSTGFAVNAAILAAINTNAASYIFLAIA